MWFCFKKKSKKNVIVPPNTMHPEMVAIIRHQFYLYRLKKQNQSRV